MSGDVSAEGQPNDAPVRLAMVGAGAIAEHHLRAIDDLADSVALTAVVEPREEAFERIRLRFPTAKRFTGISDLAQAGVSDAAIVATPHFLHYEQATELARVGLPSLVEKPLAISTREMRALGEVAEETGSLIIAGQTRRFEPEVLWAKAIIDEDPEVFGQLESFDIQSLQNINAYTITAGTSHWLLNGELAGGGVAISLAIHQLDMIRFLSGANFTEVSAFARYDSPFTKGAESQMSAVLRMSNSATGTLQASYVADRIPFSEAMTLMGEFGTLTQHAENLGDYRGPISYASSRGAKPARFTDQLAGWARLQAPPALAGLFEFSFSNQLAHFANVVRGRAVPVNTLRENFNTIACIEALMTSAREERRMTVATW